MRTPAPGRRRHARHSAAALLVLVAGFAPACGGDSFTAPNKANEVVVEGPYRTLARDLADGMRVAAEPAPK